MPVIHMPQSTRGCGTRVKGGLYAFFDLAFVETCPNLPMPLPEICPVCGEGIRFSRGIHYIIPNQLLPPVKEKCKSRACPVCMPTNKNAGLMWVGKQYYTAAAFIEEALTMGISKRIATKPEKLKIGDLVYFVHPHAIRIGNAVFDEAEAPRRGVPHSETKPGIFLAAHLTAYHKIIDEIQAKDANLVKKLEDQGITPVVETCAPPEPVTAKHILIRDSTPREMLVGIPYRATCSACDRPYGYKGANPRYCPECLVSRKNRAEDHIHQFDKKKKTAKKPVKKVTKTRKVKNGSS